MRGEGFAFAVSRVVPTYTREVPMITMTYDTELAVRAMLPTVKRRLEGFELAPAISDEELVKCLTEVLAPVVKNSRIGPETATSK